MKHEERPREIQEEHKRWKHSRVKEKLDVQDKIEQWRRQSQENKSKQTVEVFNR